MARPVKQRKVISPYPETEVFPFGEESNSEPAILFLSEEFESIKLIDYENLNHNAAAKLMKISRPTFTRIYKKARIKISTALVEKRSLKLSRKNTYFDDNWLKCNKCECIFNEVKDKNDKVCPICGSSKINII